MRLLAKSPKDRFANATSVRLALEEALTAPARHRTRVRRVAGVFVGGAMALSMAAGLVSYRAMHVTPRGPEASVDRTSSAVVAVADAIQPAPPATGTAALDDIPPPPPLESLPAPIPAVALNTTPTATPTATTTPAATPTGANANATPTASAPPSATSLIARTTGRADLASLADARDAAKSHPSDPHALKAWALAASRAGALREARHAGEAWSLRDDSSEPRLFLASVLDATGHHGDARTILAQWLELHPDASDARKMQARLTQTSSASTSASPSPRLERATHKTIDR
jgi:hypothetical protein